MAFRAQLRPPVFPPGPPGSAGAPGTLEYQRISSAASANSSVLATVGGVYMIAVSATTSVRFRSGTGTVTAVTTDMQLSAGGFFEFTVRKDGEKLAFLPDAGTMEVYVWRSE